MSAVRPDPDALLARVQREEAKARRGKLKVFFGATAGVGKTYAMLEDARALKARGVDVVVGYVEPHGRAETEVLLEGLERLPYRQVAHRGAALRDFDLDAALARKPRTLLVDELAHSNPLEGEPRPRHAKRWQDVEELLEAGITVHTTVNVQHVESLNDIVAGITGVRMQETVPDSVFERADEVVMIDTPPDVLLERLQAGKVYIPEQARNAVENFFRKGRRIALLRLAESLGAEAVTLGGSSAGEEIANYARERNVTRVVIGRPRRPLWQRLFRASTYGELVAGTEGIDILVVGGADEASALRNPFFARSRPYMDLGSNKLRWPGYAVGLAAVALCTAIGTLMSPMFELVNIAMVYLLAVVLIAVRFGRGPAIAASVLAVAAFDFFFVPPLLTFAVSDVQYLITFAIMLMVALIISSLTVSVRLQANVAGLRERRTAMLYAMTRELAATRGQEPMARAAVRHVSEVFESQAVVLFPDAAGRIRHPRGASTPGSLRGADLAVAQWVQDHGEPAGLGTDTLPSAESVYLPLKGSQAVLGVLAVLPANVRRVLLPEQFHLLETFAGQIAISLERALLAEQAQRAQVDAETEGLRNALLASISHDLRTPLAVISGASSSLVERGERLGADERKALAASIFEQSQQMGDLVGNMLEMTRLEAGAIALNRDWHSMSEIAGSMLRRLQDRLESHPVEVDLPMELPLVRVDAALIEQVLANLIENAAKHTPPGTRITLRVDRQDDGLLVSVEDAGPGLPAGDPEQLFAKFHRGNTEGTVAGVGLGLAICRAIVRLHGGRIWAETRAEGGAAFRFTLPVEPAPQVPREA